MKLNVKFKENKQRITPKFGEVFNASDGGFERGYDAGYAKGETAGYNKGTSDGYTTGYNQGNSDGYANGYENGYDSGYTEGAESSEVFTDGYYALPYTKKLSNLFNGKAFTAKDIYRKSLHLEEVEYLYNGIIKLNYTFYGCTSLKKAYLPKAKGFEYNGFSDFTFGNCTALQLIQLGSVGFPISQMVNEAPFMPFAGCTDPELVIEIYCNYATLSELPTALTKGSPWGATNATIIYRNSTTGEVITE